MQSELESVRLGIAKRASDVMTQTRTRTNKLEWWMILKISLRAKALVKRKLRLHFLYFPQNMLILTESRWEFSDLHSIFRHTSGGFSGVTGLIWD